MGFRNALTDPVTVTGSVAVTGPVQANITNAELDVAVTGPVQAHITNAELEVAVNGPVAATITNAELAVNVNGTVPVEIGNASIVAQIDGGVHIESGTVEIGNEVHVLGGGEVLLQQVKAVGSASVLFAGALPRIGWAGYRVQVSILDAVSVEVQVDITQYGLLLASSALRRAPSSMWSLTAAVPALADASAPVEVRVNRTDGSSTPVNVQVLITGVSAAPTCAETPADVIGAMAGMFRNLAVAAGALTLPPSLTPYWLRFRTAAGSTLGNVTLQQFDAGTPGTWTAIANGVHLPPGVVGSPAGTLPELSSSWFLVGGTGKAQRLNLQNVVGTVDVTMHAQKGA